MSLVSIVMSVFNHEAYVEQAVRSIYASGYSDIEVLIADDGSTDSGPEILQGLSAEFGFRFWSQPNKGWVRSLSDLIDAAKGEYIALIGSDDLMCSGRIARQVLYMEEHPEVGICSGGAELIDEHGYAYKTKSIRGRTGLKDGVMEVSFDDILLRRTPHIIAPTMMIRKSVYQAVGGLSGVKGIEDLYLQLKIAGAGYVIAVLPDVLISYRRHPNAMNRNVRALDRNVREVLSEYCDHSSFNAVLVRHRNSMLKKSLKYDVAYGFEVLSREGCSQLGFAGWSLVLRLFVKRVLKG